MTVTFPRNPNGTFGKSVDPQTVLIMGLSAIAGALILEGGKYIYRRFFKKGN